MKNTIPAKNKQSNMATHFSDHDVSHAKAHRSRRKTVRWPKEIRTLAIYSFLVGIALIYWEILMAIQMGGVRFSTFFFLFFIPAEALFFSSLCGIYSEKASRISFPIIMFIPCAYYIAQSIYLRNFASLFSISMAGMGNEALGNFGWALKDTLKSSVMIILLLLVPIILAVIFSVKNKPRLRSYHPAVHAGSIAMTVALYLLAVLLIRCFGTGRLTPYYLMTNPSVATDTAAKKLGVMTTGIIEGGSYYFGIKGSEDEFQTDFVTVPTVPAAQSEKPAMQVVADTVSDDSVSSDDMPVVPEVPRIPWVNESIDLAKIASEAEDAELKSLAGYFASREPSATNEYTGMFTGYNLIYICAEGFWTYACNERVTPTLYKMANNGIVLTNYYNSMKNTTTNGEFAFATGLWPDDSRIANAGTDVGSFARSSFIYMPQGLGDLFGAQGIPSYAFHNYYGKYYRRSLSWPNLGYKCKFMGEMQFTSAWPASDLELMEQSVDDYINEDQFHAYYMTFSGHGPYSDSNTMFQKNIGTVDEILGDAPYNTEARGYLAGELELDRAMEYLLKRLEDAGKLDNTVIVIAGDHYPYYLSTEGRNSLVGHEMDEDFEIYHSTCIIYNAGMQDPLINDTYCCNVDIAPTMLNLFDIPHDSRLIMGKDIFSEGVHRAALLNKSFLTDQVKYNYETGDAQWTESGRSMSESEQQNYLDAMLALVENEYTASCKIINDNFFLKIYKMSGLISEEEEKDEIAREERAKAQDEVMNVQDAEKEAEWKAKKDAEAAAALLLQQQTDNPADPNAPAAAPPNAVAPAAP